MPAALTHEQFLQKLADIRVPYTTVDTYSGTHTPLTWICNNSHTWKATPKNILKGSGCPTCSNKIRKTTGVFLQELSELNDTRSAKVYLCDGQEYTNAFSNLTFVCDKGHTWITTPSNIINSQHSCKRCCGKMIKTHVEFIQELEEKRPNVKVHTGTYVTAHTKLTFACDRGHLWNSRPIDILIGYGCPHCVRRGYSQKSIQWLNSISDRDQVSIQHAENGGEFLIPGTRWYADGYCTETNTVYEFYGDAYHGNINVFHPNDRCHPYDKSVTAQWLYDRTLEREEAIRQLGYNVVTLWEKVYDTPDNT